MEKDSIEQENQKLKQALGEYELKEILTNEIAFKREVLARLAMNEQEWQKLMDPNKGEIANLKDGINQIGKSLDLLLDSVEEKPKEPESKPSWKKV